MSKKLISLVISLTFIITIGFKEMVYADTYVSGTVTASLNIRSGPSTSYSILGGFSKGSTIKIVEKNGDWLKVQYKTSYGYVSGKYVTSIYDDVIDEGAVINCTYLNVRSGPSSSYSSRGVIAKGQKVYIMGKESNWYEILYNGSAGYVSKTYISTTSTGNGSNSNEKPSESKKTGTVTADALNVRQQPTTSSAKLGLLYKNETVQIVDDTGSWYKILYKNNYAFVSKNYVVLGGTQSGTTQTVTNLNNFLFVGDSFTSRLKTTIQQHTTGSYVNAKGGAFPSHWLQNFNQMPDNSKVKGVVLLIGINGISRESNYTDTKKLIDLLSSKYVGKTIYVQKVFPVGKGYYGYSDTAVANYNKNRIDKFNASIKAHCDTKSNVKFIDTTSGFVDANGFLINCETDGLHILDSKNKMFFDNIQTAVISASK
ncbi:SH3 domain-containing protein [Intestinibacter bartlettii]|uniref:SH3 domain-containing protein n=1 Tax=Intestinibacter bartlettii TaxID=261299 RepID=UPI000820891F|nr:SH3 domain-containing protein [Intestinibacter bartlettii]SCI99034.1 Uncharacterized protein with a bacterial SH3 domain homologue [uncultured Clostridium sp.]